MENLNESINEKPNVRPLTKKEIIKFCNDTIKEIKLIDKDSDNPLNYGSYLCEYLREYVIGLNNYDDKVEKSFYIPEFTNDNAVKYCNGMVADNHRYWWSGNFSEGGYDAVNRIKFLEWLKSHYVTPEE